MIVGIDPGLDGAIAWYDGDDLTVEDMPTFMLERGGKQKRAVDGARLAALLRARVDHVFVERVAAMPKQGVSSVFSFGQSYGLILGVLAALQIPHTTVQPAVWKRALAVPKSKDGARARATELLPAWADLWPLVKHDGRAEAAMIALYGSRKWGVE